MPIEKYGKTPNSSGKQHFYSYFQNPSENSVIHSVGRFYEYPLICFKIQFRTEEIISGPTEFLKCRTLQDRKVFLSECLIIESILNKFLNCKVNLYMAKEAKPCSRRFG